MGSRMGSSLVSCSSFTFTVTSYRFVTNIGDVGSSTDVSRIPGTCSSPSRVCSHRLTSREFSRRRQPESFGPIGDPSSPPSCIFHRYASSIIITRPSAPESQPPCCGAKTIRNRSPLRAGRPMPTDAWVNLCLFARKRCRPYCDVVEMPEIKGGCI